MRATYRRLHGVRHFLGFYDVHTDCLGGVFRPRKRIVDLLAAFRRLRRCYPRRRLVAVMDNLHNIHDHPHFLHGLARLRITPVFADAGHGVRQRRIYRFLRYRHRQRGLTIHPLTRLHLLRPIKWEEHWLGRGTPAIPPLRLGESAARFVDGDAGVREKDSLQVDSPRHSHHPSA
jgi:hypothetical protein